MTDPEVIRTQLADAGGLVTVGQLAREWGWSAAHVHKLIEREDFPEHVAIVHSGAVSARAWLHCDAAQWRSNYSPRVHGPAYITKHRKAKATG